MNAHTKYKVSWRSPANIALIKYWGKEDVQLPTNSSLSLTLHNSYSLTELDVNDNSGQIEFFYNKRKKEDFLPKIKTFFSRIKSHFNRIDEKGFRISSINTFPHSTGIASSASFFGSLALCIMSYKEFVLGKENGDFFKRASYLARLGSGSACRSIFPEASLWKKASEYATPFKLNKIFASYQDSIIIVSKKAKPISSSQGHQLMKSHPYRVARYKRAEEKLQSLIKAMASNDLNRFCDLVECEALELHGLMMSTEKSFILMEPSTLEIIQQVRSFRKETGCPVCFTLDAGPNVHLLYPLSESKRVKSFIHETINIKNNYEVIHDKVGKGPEKYGCP